MDIASHLRSTAPTRTLRYRHLDPKAPVWVNVRLRPQEPLLGIVQLQSVGYYSTDRRSRQEAVLGFAHEEWAAQQRDAILRPALSLGDLLVVHELRFHEWAEHCDRMRLPIVVVLEERGEEVHVRWPRPSSYVS